MPVPNYNSVMRKLFVWNTKIAESQGRYHPVLEEEPLGSYATAQQAAEDLAGGHTFSISGGIDTSTLGIPDEVTESERTE
jgi:hypothetical protein